jgi:hypothetical protein
MTPAIRADRPKGAGRRVALGPSADARNSQEPNDGGVTDDDRVRRSVELDDIAELRRLADAGSNEAVEALVGIAGERADLTELRRLADSGSDHAAEVLADLCGD